MTVAHQAHLGLVDTLSAPKCGSLLDKTRGPGRRLCQLIADIEPRNMQVVMPA